MFFSGLLIMISDVKLFFIKYILTHFDIFGDKKTLEKVMTRKQEISPLQAKSLAIFFNRISPELALTSQSFL
jgi:hypothetical protein